MNQESKNEKDLSGTSKKYWRSLDELEKHPEFEAWVQREFPEGATDIPEGISRRKFLSIMGASMALAGLSGCRRPVEKLVPYVKAPDASHVPGVPEFYATAMPNGIDAYPLLVRSNDGRPTKVEGNSEHPLSKGGANIFAQASILGLYDPDRLKEPLKSGAASSNWAKFLDEWRDEAFEYRMNKGKGLALLTESFNSLSLKKLLDNFKETYPNAEVCVYEPCGEGSIVEGLKAAWGQERFPIYDYTKTDIVLSLGADIFSPGEPMNVTASKGFSSRRRVKTEKDSMNRLYVVECDYSITGAMADHRLKLPTSQISKFLTALAYRLSQKGVPVNLDTTLSAYKNNDLDKDFIEAVVEDLIASKGTSIIVPGKQMPPNVHALASLLNHALGNIKKTVSYKFLPNAEVSSVGSLKTLSEKINTNQIKTLVIASGNPVYNAPADLKFDQILKKVKKIIQFSEYQNETSEFAKWVLPKSHFLESWGDVSYLDGTLGVVQPLISPLYKSKSIVEFFNIICETQDKNGYEVVRNIWREILPSPFEESWKKVLHDGFFVLGKQSIGKKDLPMSMSDMREFQSWFSKFSFEVPESSLEVNFKPSATVYDGRFSNNGWLQELPDPMTKVAWDNSAIMSVNTAKSLGLNTEFGLEDVMKRQVLELSVNGKTIEIPAWIQPGHADSVITLALGYGRKKLGRVADDVGVNVYPLMNSSSMTFALAANARQVPKRFMLATTQNHGSMEGRPIVVEASLEEYRKKPSFASDDQVAARILEKNKIPNENLWEDVYDYTKGNQWGMAIDLNVCTGCNACAVACQSENNIPIVGKEQTAKGRNMHWIRIDRYFSGSMDNPDVVVQPVACHHCENAPCEQVCPVAATVHTEDGLNSMVYNRCVGTRYCANNCPYKVRRFNFFNYANDNPVYHDMPEVMKLAQNPEVSVRFRGVMEKCTYCTQRISNARIQRKNKGEELQDGDIKTACQQSCPTDAIVFGDINDPESKVSKVKAQNRNYEMLAELNIKPRTSYLAKLRNPNSRLDKKQNKLSKK